MRICIIGSAVEPVRQKWAKHFAQKGHEVHMISLEKANIPGVAIHYLYPMLKLNGTQKNVYSLVERNRIKNVLKKIWHFNRVSHKLFTLIIYPFEELFFRRLKLLKIKRELSYALQCRRIIRSIKPDVLHGHYLYNYAFYGALAGFKPYIVSAGGSDVLLAPKKNWLFRRFSKIALRKADVIIAISDVMKEELINYFKVSPLKIIRYTLGIDLSVFSKDNSTKSKHLRQILGIKESDRVIISFRNIDPTYNTLNLIRSVPEIIKHNRNVIYLILAGKAKADYLRSVKNEISAIKIDNNVRLIEKFLSWKGINELLNISDISVSIPKSESYGNSVVQSMACATIPIVSDTPAMRELIEDGVNGFILSEATPSVLAEKINYCLNNLNGVRKWIAQRNYYLVKRKHNWNENIKVLENIYKNYGKPQLLYK